MYVILGKPACTYCKMVVDFLTVKGQQFEYRDILEDNEAKAMFDKTGARTVPQIFKDGECIGGFSELMEVFK